MAMATDDVVRRRLRNQHLVGASFETPDAAVQWLGAVQSQDYGGAKWALGQRVKHTTSAEIDEVFNAGEILRTHVMRPTWHFVSPSDIRWLLELTAPRVRAANSYYYRKFELDDDVLRETELLLAKELQGGKQLTRQEVAQTLLTAGITAGGLRLGYILMNAELNAVICSGALKGKQHTYALLDERVRQVKPVGRGVALGELAERYFTSRGYSQLQDFVWWSGLTVADAKSAIGQAGAKLAQHEEDDKVYWSGDAHAFKGPESPESHVHLLPNYDEYLIAYKDRSAYTTVFSSTPTASIFDGHILVVNGKVCGAWRVTSKRSTAIVTVAPLVALGKAESKALREAVDRYGRFLGASVELVTGEAKDFLER
jgi:hypothetical protein